MKEIRLTNGDLTQVDDADFPALSMFVWQCHTGYAARRVGSARKRDQQWVFMARAIMDEPKGYEVDHRDRDKLNNQRANLRACLPGMGQGNQLRYDSKVGRIGVRQSPSGNFQAKIFHGGKNCYLGSFPTSDEAARAYDAAALRLRGEFAILNFAEKEEKPCGASTR